MNVRRAAIRALVVATLAAPLVPCAAFGYWPEQPTPVQVRTFLDHADSVLVWSITLPDSAAARDVGGVGVLRIARVRARAAAPVAWGRTFAAALFEHAGARGICSTCNCGLVRDGADSVGAVVPVVEYRWSGASLWVPVVFRTRCAGFLFAQGSGGNIDLGDSVTDLLRLVRQALPSDSAFAADSVPRWPRSLRDSTATAGPETLPEAIAKTPPEYPDEAREQGVYGTVQVMALVGTDGTVKNTRVAWSIPGLDAPALTAVRRWKFTPASYQGKPVAVWVTVPVKFSLH